MLCAMGYAPSEYKYLSIKNMLIMFRVRIIAIMHSIILISSCSSYCIRLRLCLEITLISSIGSKLRGASPVLPPSCRAGCVCGDSRKAAGVGWARETVTDRDCWPAAEADRWTVRPSQTYGPVDTATSQTYGPVDTAIRQTHGATDTAIRQTHGPVDTDQTALQNMVPTPTKINTF